MSEFKVGVSKKAGPEHGDVCASDSWYNSADFGVGMDPTSTDWAPIVCKSLSADIYTLDNQYYGRWFTSKAGKVYVSSHRTDEECVDAIQFGKGCAVTLLPWAG